MPLSVNVGDRDVVNLPEMHDEEELRNWNDLEQVERHKKANDAQELRQHEKNHKWCHPAQINHRDCGQIKLGQSESSLPSHTQAHRYIADDHELTGAGQHDQGDGRELGWRVRVGLP